MNFGNPVELLDAEEIGLDTNVYEGTYYKYSGNFVNMDDGSKMSAVYSADMLNRSSAYNFILVDENNVAVDYLNDFYPWTSAVAPTVYIQGERDYAHYGIGDVNSNNASDVTKADWGEADGNTNYFDWLYCHKMGIDYEGFEKVPTSIIKVALVNGIVDVDVEDDLYIIENLTDGTFVCNESDNIHTIRVFELGTEKTGDAALEYLKAAPQIVYMPIADYYDDGVLVFIVATMTADK